MDLVLYGSFNCPYSYLASLRADRLVASGAARIEWRAVVHDPDVPAGGKPVDGELKEMFDREFDEIRELLAPGEPYPARHPPVQPNTTAAVAGFSTLEGDAADSLRAKLFDAFWVAGADIGSQQVLNDLGCPPASPGETMRIWQSDWSGMERSVVPMLLLPDGKVSRGLGALTRLGHMEAEAATPTIQSGRTRG